MKKFSSILLACSLVSLASAASAFTVTNGSSTQNEIAAAQAVGTFYEGSTNFRNVANCNMLAQSAKGSLTAYVYAPLNPAGQPDFGKMKIYSDRVQYGTGTSSVILMFKQSGIIWKLEGGPGSPIVGPNTPTSTTCTACVLKAPTDTACAQGKASVTFALK